MKSGAACAEATLDEVDDDDSEEEGEEWSLLEVDTSLPLRPEPASSAAARCCVAARREAVSMRSDSVARW